MPDFVHLHNHTEFSLLDGAAKIDDLTEKACSCGMSAVAISDHGNMFGVPKFVLAARKKGLKPVVGCEFYITAEPVSVHTKTNRRYHQILFAKNETGYKNLVKLCSYGYTDGFYYKPRIDKEMLKAHSEGLVATTCCLASEINQAILSQGESAAQEILKWYLDVFGEDYYVEIQRHGLKDQDKTNEQLLKWAKKYNLKVIATNDVHYVNKEDSEAHDLLLALQTSSDYSDPNRFRFTDDANNLNPEFYFKTPQEMQRLFHDVPEALDNTLEIVDKCEFELNLNGDLFLPQYQVPDQFSGMDDYLAHLVWQGARVRYKEITQDISERITHELNIIKSMGFAGYFLIVQGFTSEARNRGVYVGPGRGSAAGSVVAYCLGIIDVDPVEYQLLFERFLNPDRISPPDIDIDFDDEGRQAVIDFVVEEYGRKSVSQVITYGTMGAKTALRDVGRTLGVPLSEVNRIAKLIPDRPGMSFKKALSRDYNSDNYQALEKTFQSPDQNVQKMMRFARTLEGTARHTGVHACAVIIAPDNVTEFVPVSLAKDKSLVTQYDGPHAEKCGLLKMDFLGLKTLSIIKTAIQLVKENHEVEIDPDNIDMEDPITFELYQRGETIATFQFESDGMRRYLQQLKPTTLEDLIAMNALYRPGPMDNIPSFINRKHGREPIEYPHPLLEPILKNTYGIMVYQEQIMQVAQTMANYSLGQADILRRAMGKKKMAEMQQQRIRFIEGAKENEISKKKAEEVFDTMEKFAQYGFNKSHAAAYSILAFKTAYLKANYPAEYMAAVLTHNVNDISKITFFIEECRRMGIKVLPPSVNESQRLFSVNDEGQIRFGLEAIKGVGKGVCEGIIQERHKNGEFKDIFDLTTKVPSGTLNRKAMESLAFSGALDCFGVERSRFFKEIDSSKLTILDKAIHYGNKVQEEKRSNQASLFGGLGGNATLHEAPEIPRTEPWTLMQRLNYEKEVIGFYLSGHPLDEHRLEIETFTSCPIAKLDHNKDREVRIAGIVTAFREGMTRRGNKYAIFTIEDFSGSIEMALFGDEYAKFLNYVALNNLLLIKGIFQPSFRDPNVYEMKVRDIGFLAESLEKYSKELRLKINIEYIDEQFIKKMDEVFETFKGNCPVSFSLVDPGARSVVKLNSRTARVKPSNEVIKAFETLGVKYELH